MGWLPDRRRAAGRRGADRNDRPEPASCPTTIVWPMEDRVIPFAGYGVPMLEAVPGAQLVRLGGVTFR
ncbi:hypothetical protein GCM10023175_28960 [Pseudonocardia xishanensis]|uniref:Uncharacterized protein n=1 Tax=Pseudonocardia xishanensis TaxID=630995 RepID=A0ABP8RTU3_9PSEU